MCLFFTQLLYISIPLPITHFHFKWSSLAAILQQYNDLSEIDERESTIIHEHEVNIYNMIYLINEC